MEKFCWKGHASMLGANTMWGLMSPLSKLLMAGGAVTPLVVTDLRIGGAMVLFWIASLFQKPEHVNHKDLITLFFASLFAIVKNRLPARKCWALPVGQAVPCCSSLEAARTSRSLRLPAIRQYGAIYWSCSHSSVMRSTLYASRTLSTNIRSSPS